MSQISLSIIRFPRTLKLWNYLLLVSLDLKLLSLKAESTEWSLCESSSRSLYHNKTCDYGICPYVQLKNVNKKIQLWIEVYSRRLSIIWSIGRQEKMSQLPRELSLPTICLHSQGDKWKPSHVLVVITLWQILYRVCGIYDAPSSTRIAFLILPVYLPIIYLHPGVSRPIPNSGTDFFKLFLVLFLLEQTILYCEVATTINVNGCPNWNELNTDVCYDNGCSSNFKWDHLCAISENSIHSINEINIVEHKTVISVFRKLANSKYRYFNINYWITKVSVHINTNVDSENCLVL